MRYALCLLLAAAVMSLSACGAAVDASGQVVSDEVRFSDTGQPQSPYTGQNVELYSNHDVDKDQSFRWVEKQVPCFECEGAGMLPKEKVITLKDPLRTCLVCNGGGFLTYGEIRTPMAPPRAQTK